MNNTEEAFNWIISLLESNGIPFRISGGFAARIHGAKRELDDIDIDIRESDIDMLYPYIKDKLIFGPEMYLDESWDLYLATLDFNGQLIDLAGATKAKIFDLNTNQWVPFKVDFNDMVTCEVFGKKVKVIKVSDLISYKNMLKREVDISDIKELNAVID